MYTAKADTLGPYGTEASIPAGNVLRCACLQAQVPLTMRYSMISHWITTATTWRLASLCEHRSGDLGAPRPPAQVPVSGMITH